MFLGDIIKDLDILSFSGSKDIEITGITHDSREVRDGYLFIALKGFNSDGHDFIQKAISSGASAVLIQDDVLADGVSLIRVEDTRKSMADIACAFYNNPSSSFDLIGITGTNGKTTTSYLIKSILENMGNRVGLVGTIGNIIDGEFIPTTHTTPESPKLQETFALMRDRGVNSCIMEVSSHSLDLFRVHGTSFDIGVFTNLTPEHMDFHLTLDNYFDAKSKLFFMSQKNNVINLDDEYGQKLAGILSDNNIPYLSYGFSNEYDIFASDIVNKIEGAKFKLNTPKGSIDIDLHAPGKFNVYNALAACASCYALGVSLEDMANGLSKVDGVRGRFEVFSSKKGFSVIIDYAHTPDGYNKLFDTVNEFCVGKKTVIFGCGGDRDATKRPVMGEIAASKNDFVIITTDNPRTEDPQKIIKDIIPGIERVEGKYTYIVDRKEAIEYAINNAVKDDVILVIGKGHESYQLINGVKHPFNEKEIIENAIAELDSK